MNILKNLSILACCGLSTFYGSLDHSIQKNEIAIDALQKQIDTMRENGEAEEKQKALQEFIDEIVQKQNRLLEQKATGSGAQTNSDEPGSLDAEAPTESTDATGESSKATIEDTETKVRKMVQEELKKAGLKPKSNNPYDDHREPTPAELEATKKAEAKAPELPEKQSEAMAQYEHALGLFKKGHYKESAASFGRIVKTYPKDQIAPKALVHIAFCLEKQGNLENAAVVCESALKSKLDETHKIDCQIIRMRYAKSKADGEEVDKILKELNSITLTEAQKKELGIQPKKPQPAAKPAPAKTPDKPTTPKDTQILKEPTTPKEPKTPSDARLLKELAAPVKLKDSSLSTAG